MAEINPAPHDPSYAYWAAIHIGDQKRAVIVFAPTPELADYRAKRIKNALNAYQEDTE